VMHKVNVLDVLAEGRGFRKLLALSAGHGLIWLGRLSPSLLGHSPK